MSILSESSSYRNNGINPYSSASASGSSQAVTGTSMSPYERAVYGTNPLVTSALSNYANYTGSALPSSKISMSSNIAAPNIPGSISMNTKSAYVDPNAYNKINTQKYYVDPEQAKFKTDQTAMREAAHKVTDFEIDTDDNVYKWKQEQARKNALTNLSGMGLSGSKYGLNTMADAYMRVMADEAESQYNRAVTGYGVEQDLYGADYQTKSDLYSRLAEQQNMQYQRDYTKENDLYNRLAAQKAAQYDRDYQLKSDNWNRSYQGAMAKYQAASDNWSRQYQVASDNYNRAFQNAQYTDNLRMNQYLNTYNMANQQDNQRYGRILDSIQIGAGAAASAGAASTSAGNAIGGYYSSLGQQQSDAYYASGNASANMWSGIGSAAGSAYGAYRS